MRRMFSEKQLLELVKNNPQAVVNALLGQDISVGNLSVSGSINGEENPSVKPIYFHPIRFNISGTIEGGQQSVKVIQGSMTILNNSSEALDTFAKLREYLYNEGSRIDVLCAIDFFNSSDEYVGQILRITGDTSYINIAYTKDGSNVLTGAFASSEFTVVSDNVNQIN